MAEQRVRRAIPEHIIATIMQELASIDNGISFRLADDKCSCWFERPQRLGQPVQLSAVFTYGHSALSWVNGLRVGRKEASDAASTSEAELKASLITITRPKALWHAFGGPQRRLIEIPENPAFDLGKLVTGLRAVRDTLVIEFWPVEETNDDKGTPKSR